MACVVQYAENWYRGKITQVKKEKVDVQLVDFGTVVCVDKNCMKEIEQEFVHTPPLAFHCSLQGVEPTVASQLSTRFKQATSDKELVALFIGRSSNGKYSVILSERTNGSDVVINNLFIPIRLPTASNPCVVSNVPKKNPSQIMLVNILRIYCILFACYLS